MLRHLHISNFALIEEISLEFDAGLAVLTGETGAGKSLLLDALMLLAGGRATPSLVRSGSERATVEAVFEVESGGPIAKSLLSLGLESADAGEILLRRELMATGRSRASINGRLVPLSQLESVAATLIELNGQHDQQSLLDPSAQRDFFDEFSGLLPLRKALAEQWQAAQAAAQKLEDMERQEKHRLQQLDFLRFQVEELEGAALQPGELEELNGECQRLSHVEALIEQGARASALVCGGEPGEACALDLLSHGASLVEAMFRHDASLAPIVEALTDVQARLSDASADLSRYLSTLETDPSRLGDVIERQELLRRILRKYGPSEADALARLESLQSELEALEQLEVIRGQAEKMHTKAMKELQKVAMELRRGREKSSAAFTRPLVALLKDFSMPKVRLEIRFREITQGMELPGGLFCGANGAEEIEFLFSANEGEEPQPLRRVGSGGELSRIMLALRTLSVGEGGFPLLVFDEIDAGISGIAARRVSERLAALGQRGQILCVTHNPTIASAARHHYLVEKVSSNGRTTSHCRVIAEDDRRMELARLLDGGKWTEKGLALAEEMLRAAS